MQEKYLVHGNKIRQILFSKIMALDQKYWLNKPMHIIINTETEMIQTLCLSNLVDHVFS